MMKNGLLASLGGAIGACLRYGMNEIIPYTVFPLATFLINSIGSFILAFLTFSLFRDERFSNLKLFLGTGLCGGFTTMSTYALETVRLLDTDPAAALLYMMLTLFIGVGMDECGLAVAALVRKGRGVVK